MRSEKTQIILILSGVVVTLLFGVFLYREIFPEYKIYQEDYIALEEFRSSYTHQQPPSFQIGIKQIVIEREDKGPPVIDRCTSCHVALQIPYFSPTKIAHDLNGNIVRDDKGYPLKVTNDDYIWGKLDEKIADLRDSKVIEQLKKDGSDSEMKTRLAQSDKYAELKTAKIDDHIYDVTKVLQMHPLMGNETRPFEFHSIDEIGCAACHNGNGRGLTTDKAHGPVFDDQYAIEYEGPTPQFTEQDEKNDPKFAKVFNDKPGHELLFQTTPIFVGALIQAKCMLCHQTSSVKLTANEQSLSELEQGRKKEVAQLLNAYNNEKQTLIDLLLIRSMLNKDGFDKTVAFLKQQQSNYTMPQEQLNHLASQLSYVEQAGSTRAIGKIDDDLYRLLGSIALASGIENAYNSKGAAAVDPFLKEHLKDSGVKGSIFVKVAKLDYDQDLLKHAEDVDNSFEAALKDPKNISALTSDINELTANFQRGKELFVEQACYACHRIETFSRGGVGPELTNAGFDYPWFLKQSIVWPQADLPTSTMPNMRMDHVELQDLMSFLLAQKGANREVGQTVYKADLAAWEAGKKLPWEKPVPPAQMEDLRYSMTIFATQGCAACHRLQGFDSNVGFEIEKEGYSFDKLYVQQEWFKNLFPEVIHITQYDQELPGTEIVAQIEQHAKEIDDRIVANIRTNGLLEEIDKNHPETIESYYSPFRYASRAKNYYYDELAKQEKDPEKVASIKAEQQAWQDRVHRVLMMYIQIYGLGRLIGPHLNWSGIYRSDEWLMEHFHNPASHVPRSLMPIMPFDDTKFYALTNMLDQLAVKNRNATRAIWENTGFNPVEAFSIHCVQCHGTDRQGNGAIAEWIYPIPKNLHNADFLRNLTKEEAIISITHGVKGTPMPPWGEVAEDKPAKIKKISQNMPVLSQLEIRLLVDWLYSTLPGGDVYKTTGVPKWEYTPQDVLKELFNEGNKLVPGPVPDKDVFDVIPDPSYPEKENYYIKKKFDTIENIEAGKTFFLENCAVCHGNEANGSSIRAEAMQEAKPRMLTNLDWIRTRDDLRLLRSIKYGVQGTAMTPWGDFTSSLQRIQLVIFIRTLSGEKNLRDLLEQALYRAFDIPLMKIEEARVNISHQLENLQKEEGDLNDKQKETELLVLQGKKTPQDAAAIYQKKLENGKRQGQLKQKDNLILQIKSHIAKENDIYNNLGAALISKKMDNESMEKFYAMIAQNNDLYSLNNGQLQIKEDSAFKVKIRSLRKEVEDSLNSKIDALQKESDVLKIIDPEKYKEDQADIDSMKKLQVKLITETEEAVRSYDRQFELVKEVNK